MSRTQKGSNKRPATLVSHYKSHSVRGELHCGDAIDFLRAQSRDVADIVFLDPPFNLGKGYGTMTDLRPEGEYELWLLSVLNEAIGVLKEGGALYLYHLPVWAIRVAPYLERHLKFQHWIAISMKNGFARGNRLYPAHYALLYFTKGAPTVFARPKLRPLSCRHCNQLIKDYGGYRAIIEEKGVNLSDVWDDLSPVRHHNKKHRRANELPSALTDRVVAISGGRDRTLIDPFAGSGATIVSATLAGMRFVACDLVKSNCTLIKQRLSAISSSPPREGRG